MATSAGEGRAGHRGLRGAESPHTTAMATGREVGWPWWEGLSETHGLIQGFSKLAVSRLRGGGLLAGPGFRALVGAVGGGQPQPPWGPLSVQREVEVPQK